MVKSLAKRDFSSFFLNLSATLDSNVQLTTLKDENSRGEKAVHQFIILPVGSESSQVVTYRFRRINVKGSVCGPFVGLWI